MNVSVDRLAQRLEAALGADAVSADSDAIAAHQVDEQRAALVCAPATPDQLAALVRICAEAAAAATPWGGGSAMAIGNPPRQLDVVVQTARLNRLIEHDHANLTVTAQSGITLSALQAALAAQQQFVPFDAPFPDRSTLGGLVAANLNGPRRMSYGSVRDLVIGMKVVLGSGESVKAGGKVVKNVAGYDMCKLFTGSLGTLGIITELTLRVAPIAKNSATVIADGTVNQVLSSASELAQSKLLPTAMYLRKNSAEQSCQLAVWFEGFERAVTRQVQELNSIVQRIEMQAVLLDAEKHKQLWRDLSDFPLQPARAVFRVTVPPAAVAEVVRAVDHWQSDLTLIVDLSVGTIWLAVAAHTSCADQFTELGALAARHRGHAVWFAAPPALKRGVEVWGPASPAITLMREIKRQFDPKGTLNPGRFVDGL